MKTEKKEVKKSISMEIADLQQEIASLKESVKQLVAVRDSRHEVLLAKIKEVADKLGV